MALNAVLLVFLFTNPVNGLVGIMAGAALHRAIRGKVALAAEHPNRLKPSKRIGVITQFLFRNTAWQSVAITTKLDF